MENAGSAAAEFALLQYPSAKSFGVICGKGNNGGDGFVVARKLHEAGKQVMVLLLANPSDLRGDAAQNYKKLALLLKSPAFPNKRKKNAAIAPSRSSAAPRFAIFKGWEKASVEFVFNCEVLVDAVLGSGFRPPVSGMYAQAIAKINATTAPVICSSSPAPTGPTIRARKPRGRRSHSTGTRGTVRTGCPAFAT